MEVRSWLTGTRGISLPFTDRCEMLVERSSRFPELMNKAIEVAQERRWKYLELRDLPIGSGMEPSSVYYEHELELGCSENELLAGCDGSVRRAIRKAQASGLAVETRSDLGGTRQYYQLHCLTRKRQGMPPQPWKFFQSMTEDLIRPGKGFVTLVRAGGKAVAGAMFLVFGQKATYKFGASDLEFQSLRPNQLTMWSGIRELRERGAQLLSFGRTSMENEGLRRFKRDWGGKERTVLYLRWDVRQGKAVPAPDRSSGLHTLLFGRLPLWVNKRIGNALYRHLA